MGRLNQLVSSAMHDEYRTAYLGSQRQGVDHLYIELAPVVSHAYRCPKQRAQDTWRQMGSTACKLGSNSFERGKRAIDPDRTDPRVGSSDLKRYCSSHRLARQSNGLLAYALLSNQPLQGAFDVAPLKKSIGYVPAPAIPMTAPVEHQYIEALAPQNQGGPQHVGAVLLDSVKNNNGRRIF